MSDVKVAGYSGTPLPKKLGIKAGHEVALIRPPPGASKSAMASSKIIIQGKIAGLKAYCHGGG